METDRMKTYFKHVFPPVGNLTCVLQVVDREGDGEVFPAIELNYAMGNKKKTSFVLLKDSETGEDLIPALAECFKVLMELRKDVRLSPCKNCKVGFEKTHPAQKYCVNCKPGKKETTAKVAIGDTETKGDK